MNLVEFFADRNLGRYDFAEFLRPLGYVVHIHDDHFRRNEEDTVWIPSVAERGWIILSADRNILRIRNELAAVMLSGARFINLIGGGAPTLDHARNVANSMEKIREVLEATEPPFFAKLYRPTPLERIRQGAPGSVKVVMQYEQWLHDRRSEGFRP